MSYKKIDGETAIWSSIYYFRYRVRIPINQKLTILIVAVLFTTVIQAMCAFVGQEKPILCQSLKSAAISLV